MADTSFDNVTQQVKLVVWDLDETFWKGTLSEEGITPIQAHIDMIKTLVDRGIMCSICSKNDFGDAKAALEALGIWDLFVFPHIQWSPKGKAIASMVAGMGLRAENVLFLDDNHLNLEEALFFNDGIMVEMGDRDLSGLLDLPELAGKDDSDRSRLAQYKVAETKQAEQRKGGLSNVDFLRQSDVKLRIITNVEDHMDRVLELLNRTNQLNFTKIRANTADERAALEDLLSSTGLHAGLIEVQDRYGDYGIVGFFCIRLRYSGTEMKHFAFSCRTLNMGVEQWVWNYLDRPEFEIAQPVASTLEDPETVDWISEVESFDGTEASDPAGRFCLVGGCDLQQVSFYCSSNRDEFVNKQDEEGMLVRFDDVGVFINPRERALQNSPCLQPFAGYTLEDMQRLDIALAEADQILLSMYFSSDGDNLFTFGSRENDHRFWCTIPPARLKALMRDPRKALIFAKTMVHRRFDVPGRMALTRAAFEHAARLKKPGATLFILGATTDHGLQAERSFERRTAFNAMCKSFCNETTGAVFIDTNRVLRPEDFNDSDHYTRQGYFAIAEFVKGHQNPSDEVTMPVPPAKRFTAPNPTLPALEAVAAVNPAPLPETLLTPEVPLKVVPQEPHKKADQLPETVTIDPDDASPTWLADLRRSDHRRGFYYSDHNFAAQFTHRSREVLMVSFDNLSNVRDRALSRETWGYEFYKKEGWSHFGLMSFDNNWYRDERLFDYLGKLAADGFFGSYTRVVLTGTSMGAYASAAFCSLVPGSTVLAFSPQSTLDTMLVPWEERFAGGRKQDWSGRFKDAANEVGAAGKAFILYDPYFEPDAMHAARLEGPNVVHLKTWFSGHKSALFLRRAEILKPIVFAAVAGNLDAHTFYGHFRARRKLPWYINGLTDRALARGHDDLVETMAHAVQRDGRPRLGDAVLERKKRYRAA